MTAIELEGLAKEFGDVTALGGVDLAVDRGEVFGFLGPNGAGKSTTINVLLDFVRPSDGRATVLDYDAQRDSEAIHERVGVLPEGFSVYDRLTGREHVRFALRTKRVDGDPMALLERVGLEGAADRRAGGYSKGMRQRLALAMALVGEPDLLILDEPSTGLDPNGARLMRRIVREENDRGATVFFSSHILAQVETVCDRIGVLHGGEVVSVGTVQELREHLGMQAVVRMTVPGADEEVGNRLRDLPGVSDVVIDPPSVSVTCVDPDAKAASVHAVAEAGYEIPDVSIDERSLEDLFAELTAEEGDV